MSRREGNNASSFSRFDKNVRNAALNQRRGEVHRGLTTCRLVFGLKLLLIGGGYSPPDWSCACAVHVLV